MKNLAGLLILAASLQQLVLADSGAGSAASASAAASATAVSTSGPTHYHFPCNCNKIYQPVCGTDGRSYSNECILRCVSDYLVRWCYPPIFVKHQGLCEDVPCVCPAVVDPVCGSDNQTYGNECLLGCENKRREHLGLHPIKLAYRGECKWNHCYCSNVIIPVCGTDNRTYRNLCILQCISRYNQAHGLPAIGLQYGGACKQESCLCTLELNPLCASDGNTYSNPCLLHCQNRRRDQLGLPPLTVLHKGECINCLCSNVYHPVCANNGVTFRNKCYLECENKKRAKQGLPPLYIVSHGVCPCICTLEYDPVCGSDQRTYSNRCHLRCENKRRSDLGMPLIYIAYPGRCICNCNYCPHNYQPVCGSDGRTYFNYCRLNCHRVCNSDIGRPLYMVHFGPC